MLLFYCHAYSRHRALCFIKSSNTCSVCTFFYLGTSSQFLMWEKSRCWLETRRRNFPPQDQSIMLKQELRSDQQVRSPLGCEIPADMRDKPDEWHRLCHPILLFNSVDACNVQYLKGRNGMASERYFHL